MHICPLAPGDVTAIERHLLTLDLADRHARFHVGTGDCVIADSARRLDPARTVLVGVFDGSDNQLIGLAETHPAVAPPTVEMAVTVASSWRG